MFQTGMGVSAHFIIEITVSGFLFQFSLPCLVSKKADLKLPKKSKESKCMITMEKLEGNTERETN